MDKPRMKDFGFSKKVLGDIDTIAYVDALQEWENNLSKAIKKVVQAEEKLRTVRESKPNQSQFRLETPTKEWNQKGYEEALEQWNARERYLGKLRKTDIHPSWTPYLVHFNPSDPTRSQGAFARWLGVNPATVSGAKRKQISPNMAADIERWAQSVGDANE